MRYQEYKSPGFASLSEEVLSFWEKEKIFERSVDEREGSEKGSFTFYEGPPSANGTPGIHHVMARTIKDVFCRYKTMQGFQVKRKGGWDTHGLPVELQVEKELGITKDHIGKPAAEGGISIEEYNRKCRETVMKYKHQWDKLTRLMGYWVDLENPYITYENNYIESCWSLLKQLFEKDLLYKGYTIQPYSPAAGTGLSSHELNQPGCYKMVKDTSIVAQFKVKRNALSEKLFQNISVQKAFSHRELLRSINDPDITDTVSTVTWNEVFFLAWTTTPWTLPANSALAVGEKIRYVKIRTYNPYTFKPVAVILAKDLLGKFFHEKAAELPIESYHAGDKVIPYQLLEEYTGSELLGIGYEQLMPYVTTSPAGEAWEGAFRVIAGDFVSTEDGTGIVHIAPTFGADDFRAAKQAGVPAIMVADGNGGEMPIVDKHGRFVEGIGEFSGMYVKNYEGKDENDPAYKSTDVLISIKLKTDNKAFKVEKYEHSYPHCWRTDKPVLYYPLESWFIRTTACKDRMVALNKTINWKPESTGTGRFGHWLENLVDWNLSRSRFWGTPLPIWVRYYPNQNNEPDFKKITEKNPKVIGSKDDFKSDDSWYYFGGKKFEKLKFILDEIKDNTKGGNFSEEAKRLKTDLNISTEAILQRLSRTNLNPRDFFDLNIDFDCLIDNYLTPLKEVIDEIDLHRPYVDKIAYISSNKHSRRDNIGNVFDNPRQFFIREPDLIDVWFDSGAMPYAQWHYPFENEEVFKNSFPADFISEGVDQTRGWFFTLHALAVMLFDSVAFKNVVSTGLVLDKNGEKMSKRKGNVIDPFKTLETYGPDATRWYMIINAPPWDNLKFNLEGVGEVQRKFFGTLQNTYNFFALYANLDEFKPGQPENTAYTESDKWILSRMNTLISQVTEAYDTYEPTRAARAIQDFVCDDLSNWYVRLNRKRFWKGEMNADKQAAYQTLFDCLDAVTRLIAPVCPFYAERLYRDLHGKTPGNSVHLAKFPMSDTTSILTALESRMFLAQQICSLAHSIRKQHNLRVRLPLGRLIVPLAEDKVWDIKSLEELIKSEVNVKDVQVVSDDNGFIKRRAKPNFQVLGKKHGPVLKEIGSFLASLSQEQIMVAEKGGKLPLETSKGTIELHAEDLLVQTEDVEGFASATENGITVALDTTLTDELRQEGIARDFVNRVQNLRKDSGYEVTDRIRIYVEKKDELINAALLTNKEYICTETQATLLSLEDLLANSQPVDMDDFELKVRIEK